MLPPAECVVDEVGEGRIGVVIWAKSVHMKTFIYETPSRAFLEACGPYPNYRTNKVKRSIAAQ